jgi:dTDP-4-dehydrorhamnose 3,5-epimerase
MIFNSGYVMSADLEILAASMPQVLMLKPQRFTDSRGFFSESYNKAVLERAGISVDFVQDNLAYSTSQLTLRGIHFQKEPFGQAKLVSVLQGAVVDVIVDLRQSSAKFGQHFATHLSAKEGNQLFIPVGFAHGYLTLEPDTIFTYKVSNYYSPEHDSGIRFDDPTLRIEWGANPKLFVVSRKDAELPCFDANKEYFA